jgi:phenylacetate 2-hydroxylase
MRLGSERAVVANTFTTIKDLWVGHSNDLINKPQQHGFAELLGYDLSGANMTDAIRRCRKAATRALGKPLWGTYYHLLEPSSLNLTRELLSLKDGKHVDVYPYLRQIVFDLALSLTYGTVSTGVDDKFTDGLVYNINRISEFRASTQRIRDYVPILRVLIPDFASGNEVRRAEKKRQEYLDVVYAGLKERLAKGEEVDCIVNGLVKDNLSEGEIHGTCKALLQAAPDSTASSVYVAIGWLSSPIGQEFQEALYAEILKAYGGDRDRAWDMAFREENVDLLVSMYKETLRYWTTTPFALPRTTVADIAYMGTVIPTGTTMIMNAQQANHDTVWYGDDAMKFKPTRFVGNTTSLPHLTFGAGSRICPAAALSNRII